jgi:two-component system, sensor histidine kinase LadS
VVLKNCVFFLFYLSLTLSASAQDFARLFDDSKTLKLTTPLQWQALPKGAITSPAEFSDAGKNQGFKTLADNAALPTETGQEVWLRFMLPATSAPQIWYLRIPRLGVERIVLYQQNDKGEWQTQTAGDAIPLSSWPERTRNPSFQLSTLVGQDHQYFLKLEHRKPITERPQLIAPGDYIDGALRVGSLIGLMFGLFGLLMALGLLTARLYRSAQYAWFALMVSLVLMAQLVLVGFTALRLWPDSIYLNQVTPVVIPLWALASTLWFSMQVSYAKSISPMIYKVSLGLIGCLLTLSLAFALYYQHFPRELLSPVAAIAMVWNIGALVWMAWRSQSWLWFVVAGFAPLTLSMLARLAYNVGWLAHVELAQLVSVISGCLGMMVVYASMILRSRESYAAFEREAALSNVDISTGLTLGRIAEIRLPQVLQRSYRFGKPCGVVMVRWLNYGAQLGPMSSAQRGAVLAHFGARLRRLARDIDTVARYDDDHFLYLIESPMTRETVNDLGMKILSTCMRPSVPLGNGDVYNVHVAMALISGGNMSAKEVIESLLTRINQMDISTPRRMQFIDSPLTTHPPYEGPEGASVRNSEALVAKINEIEANPIVPTLAPISADQLAGMMERARPKTNTAPKK